MVENGEGGGEKSSQISGVVEVQDLRCAALTTLDYMWLHLFERKNRLTYSGS